MEVSHLIAKYDIPAPRYTSYPTVPYWDTTPSSDEWLRSISKSLQKPEATFAMYVHVPFCESLCTFCGCNTSVTRNHDVEDPYIDSLIKEFEMYYTQVSELKSVELRELHFGGGSPTYLSEQNLDRFISYILSKLKVSDHREFSIEVDPRRTRITQLEVLRKYGFSRISLGVQDFNPEVQKLINRNQTFEQTKTISEEARKAGFTSINYDLVYGLPRQTRQSIQDTVLRTISLKPDRIAFYSYAHVPWIKASQRLFTEDDLPRGGDKRELYEISRKLFEENGYAEIGMDHFALKTDGLWKSVNEKKLHRNFMGYTENKTDLLLGLGVSAISDSWGAFHQNEKILKKYEKKIQSGELPTLRGHLLSDEDLEIRDYILQLSTSWEVRLPKDLADNVKTYLKQMEEDKLILWENELLRVTKQGHPFLRNICMGLDMRLRKKEPSIRVFSQSI